MLFCFVCLEEVPSIVSMRIHVKRKHNILEMEKFVCHQNGCIRIFGSPSKLYRHIKSKHIQDTNKLIKDVQGTLFSDDNICNSMTDDDIDKQIEKTNIDSESNETSAELSFILKLCSMPNLSRKDIVEILEHSDNLLQMKGSTEQNFVGLNTDYFIQKKLVDEDLYVQPNDILLGYEPDDSSKRGACNELIQRPVHGQYLSLKDIFSKIFKNDYLLDIALEYMSSKSHVGDLYDMKDGTKFKDLPKNYLPFILFYDEVECGNPLGSHKGINKIGVIQISMRCFPPHFYSKLKNIYILSIFPATDRDYLKTIIEKLVSELKFLGSNPLLIKSKEIHFYFAGITGDNLGLNQILGFVESFQANYFCRLCKMHRECSKKALKEDPNLLRNEINYNADVQLGDYSLTGIKYNSLLNDLLNYHVTDNSFLDVMHDVLEGVAKFGMFCVIEYYVKNKFITLDELNCRVRLFPFTNLSNKPPTITKQMITTGDLSFSASEVMNLVLYFSLIIGDHITESCKVWGYYLTLRSLVDFLLLKIFSVNYISLLEQLIADHNELYMSIFDKPLKPKHHNLTHYPTCILKTGPVSHNWGMRYESKHCLLKLIAKVAKSRVNLCKTIMIRYCYILAHDIYMSRQNKATNISDLGPNNNSLTSFRWVVRKGIKFQLNNLVCIGSGDDYVPEFGIINNIFVIDCDVELEVKVLSTHGCDLHFAGYIITDDEDIVIKNKQVHVNTVSKPLISIVRNGIWYVADVGLR